LCRRVAPCRGAADNDISGGAGTHDDGGEGDAPSIADTSWCQTRDTSAADALAADDALAVERDEPCRLRADEAGGGLPPAAREPRAVRPEEAGPERDAARVPRARHARQWIHVYLPTRPNGSLGWIRGRAVTMYDNRYRLVVHLRAHRLQLWKKRKLLATYPVATGTRYTPTPRGLFYIVELLQPDDPAGAYGPYSFGLSAHSNVLQEFAGGDGRVGLHGTDEPGLIGSSVSHGCIRLRNGAVRRLARILPLGTPVYVRT
jgi:lipoprotein-anchoring transpeptidase ErfK/SrfK